jgi:hypothetical protein
MHHTPAPTIGRHGRALYQNSHGAPTKSCQIAPEGLGCKITNLPPCLQGIHSQHCRLNPAYPSVCERTPTALRPALWGTLRQELPTIDHAANLVDHLHNIHSYARPQLKLASDWMKTHYEKLANCAGYHEGSRVWLYHPTRTKGKSLKLQSSWEGLYEVVTRIDDVLYRIQRNTRSRLMVVQLDQLAPYQGTARVERPYGGSSGSSWRVNAVQTEPWEGGKGETKHSPWKRGNGCTPVGHSG